MKIRYKSNYTFYSYKDKRFRFQGAWEDGGDSIIGMDESAVLYWQGIAKDFLLVCVNHDWSGICQIKCNDNKITSDNYAPSSYQKVIPVIENEQPEMLNIEVSAVGKNEQSHAQQLAVVGFLAAESEQSFYSYQDERLKFEGAWEQGADKTIIGVNKTSILRWQVIAKDFYLLCVSHSWSGICQIKCNGEITTSDNYAAVSCQKIIPIAQKDKPEMLDIEISIIGKNEQSKSNQLVVSGFLANGLKEDEAKETVARQFPNLRDSKNKQLVNKIKQNKIHELIYQVFNQDVNISSIAQHRHSIYLEEWQKVASYINKGSKILDIGSGCHFDSLLNLFAENKWDYYYFDRNTNLVEANKEMGISRNNTLANNFISSDKINNLFQDNYFDGVVSYFYLNKLDEIADILREIKRILKNKGFVFLYTLLGLNLENNEDLYFLNMDNWKDILQELGFNLISCEINNKLLLNSENRGLSIIATIYK